MRTWSIAAATLATGLTTAQDLASVLSGQDSLSSLVELLGQYPDITNFIASQEDVTLFAPNNEAIASIDQATAADADLVQQILTYHLYNGVVQSGDISQVPLFPYSFLEGNVTGGQVASVSLDSDGNAIVTTGLKAVSNVVTADVTFDGGIIHIIDSVLTIPESVSETLLAGGLTALAGAATALDLVGTLDGLGDVTILAPNNDAFKAIAGAAAGLSSAQLIEILQYHVVSGTVVYSTLLGNTSVPTLQGTTVDIAVAPDGAVFVDGARVINSDVLIANGVLHVIDAVLNPDETDPVPNEPGFPTGDSDTVPFTSGIPEASANPELAATTSLVAEILVTAAPEPTIYLQPDGSLSTDVAGTAGSGSLTATITASSPMASMTTAGSSAAAGSASGSASSASEAPAQQTGNAGVRNGLPTVLSVVAAVGAVAFAVEL